MALLVALSMIVSICVGFFSSSNSTNTHDILSAYSSIVASFLLNNLFITCTLILIAILLFLKSIKFDKHYAYYKKFLFSTLHVLTALMAGFILSLAILFFIGCIQLNILSVVFNTNKESIGIISLRNEIISALKANNTAPEIIATDKSPRKELLAIADATTGSKNFYTNSVLRSIPDFLIIPIRMQESSILLIDNTLIVSELKASDIQAISPIVGHLMVRHYFPTKKIKLYPKISIMKKDEYQNYRRKENVIKLSKVDEELKNLDEKISSLSASLTIYKNQLNSPATNTSTINQQNLDTNNLSKKIESETNLLSEYKYYVSFYNSQKKLLQTQTENAPHESGVFVPLDSIKIVYLTNNPHSVADYFATLTHEYLHYTSYISTDKILRDPFFEEGLTEYFARMTIMNDLNTSTNLGYPVQAKIISEMTNIIPESELAQIYFTKDQEGLERALNRVYGDDFYKNTQALFDSLQYASDKYQVLKLANDIMKKIGSAPLKEKDLVTSFSNF